MGYANLEGLPYEVQLKIVRCLLRDEQPLLIVRGVNVTATPSKDSGIAAVSKYFNKLAMQVFYGENRFQYYDAYSLTFPSAPQCDRKQVQNLMAQFTWHLLRDMVAGTAVSPQVAKQVLSIRKFPNIRHLDLDLYFPCSRTQMDSTKYRRRVLAFVENSFPHIKKITATESSQTKRSSKWLANKMKERNKRWGQPQLTPKQAEEKRTLKRYMAEREKVIKALRVKAQGNWSER